MRGYLRLDLADNCNIRCIMCQAYNSQPVTAMRFFDFDRFVNQTKGQLAEWSTIQLGNVAEATVHPRFGDFLRYIRSQSNATIHIVTNGKLLRRYADLINSIGNCLVQVSMDSINKTTHEYIREGSDYDRVIANLAMLDLKRTRVLLSFTLMNSNIDEYEDMVRFCHERGYAMSAFPMILRDELGGVIPLRLLKESLWFNIKKLHDWHRKYYRNEYDKVGQGEQFEFREQKVEFDCHAHKRDLVLDAAGNGVLCGKRGLGSLSERPLERMWNSAEADEFRLKVDKDREPCLTCDYRQRCLSPSMALFENHFSERIASVVSAETRRTIASDRSISDTEALDCFIRDLSGDFGIFDIQQSSVGYTARRVHRLGVFGESFQARSRHELQKALADSVRSKYDPLLIKTYSHHNIVQYRGRFWALPLVLGVMDVQREAERQRPGVMVADSLPELLAAIDRLGRKYEIVLVQERYKAHNIVQYLGRFWGLPLALGHVDLAVEAHRQRPGVIVENSLPEILAAIDSVGSKFEEATIIPVEISSSGNERPRSWWQTVKNADKAIARRSIIGADNSPKSGGADSMRWIESSPQTELKQAYGGYKVYRYEFKFFGVPEKYSGFHYDDFLAGKYGEGVLISHSLAELKASIDRLQQSSERQSVLLAPFSTTFRDPADRPAIALMASDFNGEWAAGNTIQVKASNLFDWARGVSQAELDRLKEDLREREIGRVAIPWRHPESWRDNSLEVLASKLVDVVDIVQPGRSVRTYEGENLHRLIYNKAYLCSMFSVVPQPAGKTVLEVGCSDGLVCDIFSQLGAARVTGIDVMRTAGCGFRNPRITYRTMDAAKIGFPDQTFDISYSIATFEHLPDPCKALGEILRVTKVGGYCYVQAAPLYHTPFGHHMFAYFQDYPWIHLRKTPAEILSYMKQRGIDRKVEADHAIPCESYLAEMLTRDHVNGLFLQDFHLDEFSARSDIEVLMIHTSFEGRELLTAEIISELPEIHPDRLIEHGFEIAFRRIA